MKFYLDLNGKLLPNQTNLVEVRRLLRPLITTNPIFLILRSDQFFQGSNSQDPTRPVQQINDNLSSVLSEEGRRYRRFATRTFTAPAPPNQIAFALGRILIHDNSNSPNGVVSERDVTLGQIGNVFGHPVGRQALFNETAIIPVGVGIVQSDGILNQAAGEEGSFIYYIRIVSTGNATGTRYFYQRQPYWSGAFIPGQNGIDATSGNETYNSPLTLTNLNVASRSQQDLRRLLPNVLNPVPSQIPIRLGYPTELTVTSNLTAYCGGMAFDGLSRIWWVVRDNAHNGQANASSSRSLWAWKRFTGESPARKDVADNLGSTPLTSFPALAANVQFRDLKSARGGFLFIAADGTDASNNGTAETGALIQVNANTDAVTNVHGTSVAGIYTLGGLRSNDILEVVIDKSESYAAAGFDRVWVLHRNGLSFGDMNITTGAIASWSTVADAGATFNVIAAGSTRGIRGNPTLDGSNFPDQQYSTMDVDSNGDVYWISTQSTQPDLSVNRLNRLIGDASAHSYYSLNSVAEGGAVGFIILGLSNGTTFQCTCLRVFRRDSNDPRPDDIWMSGISDDVNTAPTIRRFEVTDWNTGNNPGAGYYQAELVFSTVISPTNLQLSPDGSVLLYTGSQDDVAQLTSLNERTPTGGTGTGVSFAAPVGDDQIVNLHASSTFDTRWIQRQVRITSTTNAVNAGSFKILAVNSPTQIVIENPSGVSETSTFNWSMKGDEFESRSSVSTAAGSLTMASAQFYNYDVFPDASGIMQLHIPRDAANGPGWNLSTPFQVSHCFTSGNWYRAVRLNPDHGDTRTGHTTFETLDSGVQVSLANSGDGGDEFVANEYYTFGASHGLIKDPTQELTYSYYGFFPCSSSLIDTPEIKTASRHTAVGGFVANSPQAGVLTENPFVLTTAQAQQSTLFQRQFVLNGTVPNSVTLAPTGTINNTNGITYAIDLGSDQVVSQLKFLIGQLASFQALVVQYDLYSATDADGPADWTLRRTFLRAEDNPQVLINGSTFRTTATTGTEANHEMIFDFGELAAASDPQFGANTAARYWKIFARTIVGESFAVGGSARFGNLAAFDSGGNPIGVAANQRLSVATDSDFLAVFPVSTVFLLDDNTIAGGSTSRGPGLNQVTLNAGTFDTDIGNGDIFRVLVGGNVTASATIDTRDSGTQLTLIGNIELFTTSDWEIVRNIDVRPRDDQGGNEDDPALPPSGPSGALQLYLDPITGYIWYSDDDVTNTRSIRFEKYVKVSRTL